MATIIFAVNGDVREFFIFREDLYELQETLSAAKRRLEAFEYMFIASIIESIDEHFSKDSFGVQEDVMDH